jgi:hypothetical protein
VKRLKFPFLGGPISCSPQKPRPAAPDIEKRLAKLELLVKLSLKKETDMAQEIEDLVAEVADIKATIDAVVADHDALIDKANAAVAASDLPAVAAAVADLKAQADRLRGVVTPPPAPAPAA